MNRQVSAVVRCGDVFLQLFLSHCRCVTSDQLAKALLEIFQFNVVASGNKSDERWVLRTSNAVSLGFKWQL